MFVLQFIFCIDVPCGLHVVHHTLIISLCTVSERSVTGRLFVDKQWVSYTVADKKPDSWKHTCKISYDINEQAVREAATICPRPCKLTFDLWPRNWCPSHVWRGLPLCQFRLPRHLCSRLRPDVRDRQTSDVR